MHMPVQGGNQLRMTRLKHARHMCYLQALSQLGDGFKAMDYQLKTNRLEHARHVCLLAGAVTAW
jgi:hypothetical protein